MGWDVLLFDLDGTLTDSGPGIMHAAETALGSFGITGLSEQALRQFVGPPLVESFAVYLPQADVQTAIDRFRAYYRETGCIPACGNACTHCRRQESGCTSPRPSWRAWRDRC